MPAFARYRCLAFQDASDKLGETSSSLTAEDGTVPSVYSDLTIKPTQQPRTTPPTVIFFSGHLRNHTLGYLMHNLVEALPSRGYRVHIATFAKTMDAMSTQLAETLRQSGAGTNGSYLILPCAENDGDRVSDAIAAIQALAPDVIVYNDLSMDGASYLLAQYRLAPVQVLTMNNGLTSGLPNVDFYVSSDATEPPNGYHDYTEQVIRLPGCM